MNCRQLRGAHCDAPYESFKGVSALIALPVSTEASSSTSSGKESGQFSNIEKPFEECTAEEMRARITLIDFDEFIAENPAEKCPQPIACLTPQKPSKICNPFAYDRGDQQRDVIDYGL